MQQLINNNTRINFVSYTHDYKPTFANPHMCVCVCVRACEEREEKGEKEKETKDRDILVSLGSCNKNTRLCGLNTRNEFFFTVLKAWKICDEGAGQNGS